MQSIIVEKPYHFIAPHRGDWVPSCIQRLRLVDRYLDHFEGIKSYEVRHAERLKESLRSGCGILLAPNHCRYADPLALGWLAREVDVHVYAMASWHLFHQSWLQGFAIRACGGFSVNREGLDRLSLNTATDILATAERPLVLFPEGTVYRTNDRLHPLLDGVSFLARTAARRREKAGQSPVVIHPIAIKYVFRGDLFSTLDPVLSKMETRITWSQETWQTGPRQADDRHSGEQRAGDPGELLHRVRRLGEALLCLKEIQFLGSAGFGTLDERKETLIERLLCPHEQDLLGRSQTESIIVRIKALRAKLVPRLLASDLTESERRGIWQRLSEIYIAQQIASYPSGYLDQPTDSRLIETVERFEEDVYDRSQIHRPWHAIIDVGHPIVADSEKPARGAADGIMDLLSSRLQETLNELSNESKPLTA